MNARPAVSPLAPVKVLAILLAALASTRSAAAQALLSGRVLAERPGEPGRPIQLGAILCFASPAGTPGETLSFRTWETEPVGWYRLSGAAATYTAVFSTPAHFARPVVVTNLCLLDGDRVARDVAVPFEHAVLHEAAWDAKPARAYYQPFVARGTSVTHVGFQLATDGVDGGGPGSRPIVLSVHRPGDGPPDSWERIGPPAVAPHVDCGGPKSYTYSAGWASGEVPTTPGAEYAVCLRGEDGGAPFQAFWRARADGTPGCVRVDAAGGVARVPQDIWLAVGADGDGLVIPYPKRVHREFQEFAGFRSRWAQTWVARGRGLASVILYAAVGGTQPPMSRQRVVVRVREGGPGGPLVGTEKVAVGSGTYTGDASWGAFGAAFAPGEVPLSPGRTYAVELESLETRETLHGFVNIKGQVSDDRPGFNPYRKVPPDDCPEGDAFAGGTERQPFDLDLQIVEYEAAAVGWGDATAGPDLVREGDAEPPGAEAGAAAGASDPAWKPFVREPRTAAERVPEWPGFRNHVLRVSGPGDARKVDGGFVQRIPGLGRGETYSLRARVRSSWPIDIERRCLVGYDPTGQETDPGASTIRWTAFPAIHGTFVPYRSGPIRPKEDAVSVWLRASSDAPTPFPFQGEFDDVELRRVRTDVP